MAARIRLGGALAVLSEDAESKAVRITALEEECTALEEGLNSALQRASDAAAEAQRVSALLSSMERERDDAVSAAAAAAAALAEERSRSQVLQSQNDLLLERLQQLLRDLSLSDERGREATAEASRLARVMGESQSEIRRLFDECAAQRARADAATASLGAALAQEKENCAVLAHAKARKEVHIRGACTSTSGHLHPCPVRMQELLVTALREKGRMFGQVQRLRQAAKPTDPVDNPSPDSKHALPARKASAGKGGLEAGPSSRFSAHRKPSPAASEAPSNPRPTAAAAAAAVKSSRSASPPATHAGNPRPAEPSGGTPASQLRSTLRPRRLSLSARTPSAGPPTAAPANPWGQAPPPPLPSAKPYSPLHYFSRSSSSPQADADCPDPLPMPLNHAPEPSGRELQGQGRALAGMPAPAAAASAQTPDPPTAPPQAPSPAAAPLSGPPAPSASSSSSPCYVPSKAALARLLRPLTRGSPLGVTKESPSDRHPPAAVPLGPSPASSSSAYRVGGAGAVRGRKGAGGSSAGRGTQLGRTPPPRLTARTLATSVPGLRVPGPPIPASATVEAFLCETFGGCSTICGSGEGDVASVPPPTAQQHGLQEEPSPQADAPTLVPVKAGQGQQGSTGRGLLGRLRMGAPRPASNTPPSLGSTEP